MDSLSSLNIVVGLTNHTQRCSFDDGMDNYSKNISYDNWTKTMPASPERLGDIENFIAAEHNHPSALIFCLDNAWTFLKTCASSLTIVRLFISAINSPKLKSYVYRFLAEIHPIALVGIACFWIAIVVGYGYALINFLYL